MEKITYKSWKSGTYAKTKYYLNGKEIKETLEHKSKCSIDWFNSLPENKNKAIEVDISDNTPYWIDEIIKNNL